MKKLLFLVLIGLAATVNAQQFDLTRYLPVDIRNIDPEVKKTLPEQFGMVLLDDRNEKVNFYKESSEDVKDLRVLQFLTAIASIKVRDPYRYHSEGLSPENKVVGTYFRNEPDLKRPGSTKPARYTLYTRE